MRTVANEKYVSESTMQRANVEQSWVHASARARHGVKKGRKKDERKLWHRKWLGTLRRKAAGRVGATEGRSELPTLVLYEVFVRNHSEEGTFEMVREDLERIHSMGVDVLWLMPHYPIGKEERKGSLGSPYSIMDYKTCEGSLGTLQDFERLANKVHELGMKLMIDIVFNHTSRDSAFVKEHPEWYKRDIFDRPTSPWEDVADFNYEEPAQWDALIDVLKFWVSKGVDGFRCDVASMVPLEFWQKAREEVDKEGNMIWLAESVDSAFLSALRRANQTALCDAELMQVFDMTYDYDLWNLWCAVVAGTEPVHRFLEMLQFQEVYLPAKAVKLRFVENHDQTRIMARAQSKDQAVAWTAFAAFNKGAFLIHAGQEEGMQKATELFEKDPIPWSSRPYQGLLSKLASLKKMKEVTDGELVLISGAPVLVAAWIAPPVHEPSPSGRLQLPKPGGGLLGLFNVGACDEVPESPDVPLEDGHYHNIIADPHAEDVNTLEVTSGKISVPVRTAVILHFEGDLTSATPLYSNLLDFQAARSVF